MEPENRRGLGRNILIATGSILILLALLTGGSLAYLALTNPGALEGDQEALLESIGVTKEEIPASITPEQEACAVEKLGQERVDEIKAGAPINLFDIAKARSCFDATHSTTTEQ